MSNMLMTRGERRGIVVLLIVLAIIVLLTLSTATCGRRGSNDSPYQDSLAVDIDSLMKIPDTSTSVIDSLAKRGGRRRKGKSTVGNGSRIKNYKERSPLDEPVIDSSDDHTGHGAANPLHCRNIR